MLKQEAEQERQEERQASGRLNPKRVVSYFKKSSKSNTIWTQELPDAEAFLITDRYALVRVQRGTELEIAFFSPYESTMFKQGEKPEDASPPSSLQENWKRMFDRFEAEPEQVQALTPTAYLYELPSRLIRRFDTPDSRRIWIDKAITSCIAEDADGLKSFLWEVHQETKWVRVGDHDGWCAIVMPYQFRAGEDKA